MKRMNIEKPQDNKIIKNIVHEETSDVQKYNNESEDKFNDKSRKTFTKNMQKQEMNRTVIDDKNNNFLHTYRSKLLEKLLSRSIQHESCLLYTS